MENYNISQKVGDHLVCEAMNCNAILLDNLDFVVSIMVEAAKLGKATVLGNMSHKFEPQGVTAIVALAESHISIHTWPEKGYASLDVYTCGDKVDTRLILEYITNKLEGIANIRSFERGLVK